MFSPTSRRFGATPSVSSRSAVGPRNSPPLTIHGLLSSRALAGHLGVSRQQASTNLLVPRKLEIPLPLPDFYQLKAEVERRQPPKPLTRTPQEAGYPAPFLSPAEQKRRAHQNQLATKRAQQTYQQLVHPLYFASLAQALPKAKKATSSKSAGTPGTLPAGGTADCFMPVTFWQTQYEPTPAGWKPRLLRKKTKNGVVYELEKFNHWRNCCNTCKRLIKESQGYVPEHRVQLLKEQHKHLIPQSTLTSGITQLDAYMAAHVPVMIGVHYKFGTTYNADHTTEHFIVLVGSGTEGGRKFYRFFDVGTRQASKGTDPRNRLYYEAGTGSFSGHSYATDYDYTISQLRFKQ